MYQSNVFTFLQYLQGFLLGNESRHFPLNQEPSTTVEAKTDFYGVIALFLGNAAGAVTN